MWYVTSRDTIKMAESVCTFEKNIRAVEKVLRIEEGFEVLLDVLGAFLVPFVHGGV